MRGFLTEFLHAFDWFVLGYFLVLNTCYLALVVIAGIVVARSSRRPPASSHDDIFANPLTPAISVLVPAFNEAAMIVASVRATLGLKYPEFEVVVVDDGSTDSTFELLQAEFDLVEVVPDLEQDVTTMGAVRSMHIPRGSEPLVVVRKVNAARRADALNVGINAARNPLVCCVDADSILEPDALLRVVKPFVDDPDRVIATGGTIRAVNGSTVYRGELGDTRQPKGWLARIQIIEYLRSFLLGRTGMSQLGVLLIISGAFGLYRRDRLVEIDGFDADSLGEDADALVGLHRLERDRNSDYRVVFVPDPICWTAVPEDRATLAKQRTRWSHGLAQVIWKYRRMMGNPRYGRIGMVALPFYLLFELLGPVVELIGVVVVIAGFAFGAVSTDFALLFAVVAVLYSMLLSVSALLVEEVSFHKYSRWRDLMIAIAAAALENVGYRQLHSWWRLKGLMNAVLGRQPNWGVMTRTAFDAESAPQMSQHKPAIERPTVKSS